MRFAVRQIGFFFAIASLLVSCSRDPNVVKQKYLAKGKDYFAQEKYSEAAIEFGKAIQVDPNFGQAHYELGLTRLKLQQDYRAAQELTLAIQKLEQDSDKDRARLDLANLFISHRDYQQANELLEATNNRQKSNPDFQRVSANYYAGVNRLPEALRAMQEAIRLDPKQSDFYGDLASLQVAAGDFGPAEESFNRALALDPKNVNVRLALGAFYQLRGRLAEAEQQFRQAIDVDPKSVRARDQLIRLLVIEGKNDEAGAAARATKRDLFNDPAGYTKLGDYYYLFARDLDRATTEYKSLFEEHPKDANVRKNLIHLLISKNQIAEARSLNDEVLKTNGSQPDALVSRAQIDLHENQSNAAVTSLQEVLARDPDNALAHYYLGEAYEQLGDSSRAASEFREAIRIEPGSVEAQLGLAEIARKSGDWSGLDQIGAGVVQFLPYNADGYLIEAEAAINLNERDRAEKSIQKAIEVAPRDPRGYVQLGMLRYLQHNYPEAEKAFLTVLELDPAASDGLRGLMNVYLAEKDPNKAVAVAKAQIAKSPNNSGFYDLFGTTLSGSLEDYPGAEQALRKAIQLDPNNTDAIIKLGQVLIKRGASDQAIALAEQGVKDHPHDAPLQLFLGERLEAQQNWDGAKASYQRVLEVQPNNPIASNNLAMLMVETKGNLDVALALAQTARRGMPDSANAADTLGWVYYNKGSISSAIPLLKEAVQKDPNDASFQYHLGLAYKDGGDVKAARDHLQRVLKISPNFPDAQDVRSKLAELGA